MTSIQSKEQIYKVLFSDEHEHDYDYPQSSTAGCLEHHESRRYHSYILRGLKNENEIPKWCEFCADVFSYKKSNPPPAEYFYRHYVNDPSTSSSRITNTTTNPNPGGPSLVRVAIYKNQIVASCRIFLRSISTGRRFTSINTTEVEAEDQLVTLNCGGIGEVCTAKNHRRRGLSTQLLKTAIEIMKELRHNNNNIQISSLHASPTYFPFYESFGYTSSACNNGGNRWSIVPVTMMLGKQEPDGNENNIYDISQSSSSSSHSHRTSTINNHGNDKTVPLHVIVRQAKFPQDTEQLHQLHRIYSEQRLVGCIIRSKEYWTNYISQELKGSLFVLIIQPATSKQQHNDDSNNESDDDNDNGNDNDNNNNDQDDDTEDNKNVEVKDVIVAWLSLRYTGTTNAATTSSSSENDDDKDEGCRRVCSFQIQEFGMNLSFLPDHISSSPSPSPSPSLLSPISSLLPPPPPPSTTTTEGYSNSYSTSIYFAFKTLIQHALNKEQQEQQKHNNNNNNNSEYDGVIIKERIETKTTISLSLPRFLRDEIYSDSNNNSNNNISNNGTTTTDDDGCDCDCDNDNDNSFYIDWKSEQTNTDNGWMYQVLSELVLPSTNNNNKNNNNDNNNNPVIVNSPCNNDHSCATKSTNNSVVNNLLFPTYYEESQSQSQQRMEHFVWPSDSF